MWSGNGEQVMKHMVLRIQNFQNYCKYQILSSQTPKPKPKPYFIHVNSCFLQNILFMMSSCYIDIAKDMLITSNLNTSDFCINISLLEKLQYITIQVFSNQFDSDTHVQTKI